MEGKEGFNTIECLRARLLAERHDSKLANEEAESLGLKFIELENKLRQEIKFRERAERRLRFWRRSLTSTDAEENETKPHSTNSLVSLHQVSKDSIQTQNGPPVLKDCDCPQDLRENPSPNSENSNNSESRLSFSSSKSSTGDSITQDTDIYSSRASTGSSRSPEDPTHSPNLNSKNDEIRHGI
ncbi:hypothetical protein K1719_046586 [Acacia pycnantha]|nr:hypothetical protein K1719_046586 [Acacia pycnantha]